MRKVVAVFCFLCFCAVQPAGPGGAAEFRLEFYSDVRGLAAEGDFDAAERLVEDAFLAAPDALPEDRIALLDTLAELQIASGKLSDAGDTLWNKAIIISRSSGADHPDLGPVYAASGRAYLQAGNAPRAVDSLEAALGVDRRYLQCDSETLARLYGDLSKALDLAGQTDAAARTQDLANDPEARCEISDATRSVSAARTEVDGEFALVRSLYATDRRPTGSGHANEFFGWERGSVTYGEVEVSIPRIHKPGNIEAPALLSFNWEENQALHIVLMSVEPMTESAFFERVAASLDPGESDEVFLFIHGFNVSFAAAAKRTAQMVYDLNFNGTPIFYSWPSRGHPGSYMSDAASVQVSARHLLGFLEDLVAGSDNKRIQIIAHSMGNRALTEALELYALRHPGAANLFDQIIFAAPDVDSGLFVFQTKIFEHLSRRMTLYTSNADLALSTSQQLHGHARAGYAVDAPLVSDAFDTIDMSIVGEGLLNHSYFATEASALSDVLWLFWRNPPPASRCGMKEEIVDAGAHWVYVAELCDGDVLLPALTLARTGATRALTQLEAWVRKAQTGPDPTVVAELLQELEAVRRALIDLLEG